MARQFQYYSEKSDRFSWYPNVKFGKAKAPRQEGHIKRSDKWLQAKYHLFNKRYFDNSLGDCTCYFRGKPHSRYGGFCWNYGRGITVNGYYSEKRVLAILLHEMIHCEQFRTGRKCDHGRWFKSRARELTILTKEKYVVVR